MKISDSTFTIVANGVADGPSQALRQFLLNKNAKRIVEISHPLVPEGSNEHSIVVYENGQVATKIRKLPHKPPYTYVFDPFVPAYIPKDDAWFGFNNLSCLRGLKRRKFGSTKKVIYWAVDFSPNRFGDSFATKVYDKVDSFVSRNVDYRVELSNAAMDGRSEYLKLRESGSPGIISPMGAWLDRTPKTTPQSWDAQKIVYLGHLVERQGVDRLVKAMQKITKANKQARLEIVGGGTELDNLKKLAKELGLEKKIIFHGFVKDHKEVEQILASGTVAAAPYVKDPNSFTQFADPGKLKAYLGASLPIVMTDVPPNSYELEKTGAAYLVKDDSEDLSKALLLLLSNKNMWLKSRNAATKVAKEFDWDTTIPRTLSQIGFET